MNIFEELIEELREENLLENTVVDSQKKDRAAESEDSDLSIENGSNRATIRSEPSNEAVDRTPGETNELSGAGIDPGLRSVYAHTTPAIANPINTNNIFAAKADGNSRFESNAGGSGPSSGQIEFFHKRAANEVLALQMVEQVLTGVEKKATSLNSKIYDELPVKKALHDFLQVSSSANSSEHAQAEFNLMQETETWYTALSNKDEKIKSESLREYCETVKPALSSQALLSLARFYRNAAFSESAREKFELIITRLYTRESGKFKRNLKNDRDELVEILSKLYAEWSSLQLYTSFDESEVLLAVLRFEDFINEAESATSVENLLKTDFFNRYKVYKQSTQELFFAPLVTATVVETNVRIGNHLFELIEREKNEKEKLLEIFSETVCAAVSDALGKTLKIGEILESGSAKSEPRKEAADAVQKTDEPKSGEPPVIAGTKKPSKTASPFQINKWLIAVMVLTLIGTVAIYAWVESTSGNEKISENVKNVNLDNSSLKEVIQTARISTDTFYAVVTPQWDGMTREQKQEVMSKIMLIGTEKGFVRVSLMNKQGKVVGYASPDKVEIVNH